MVSEIMKKQITIFVVLFLIGCMPNKEQQITDQCKRQELFAQCMSLLPKGPERAVYNDWDEVVSECQSYSFYTSRRKRSAVSDECQSH